MSGMLFDLYCIMSIDSPQMHFSRNLCIKGAHLKERTEYFVPQSVSESKIESKNRKFRDAYFLP